jgi:hypothetical protein
MEWDIGESSSPNQIIFFFTSVVGGLAAGLPGIHP